MAQVDKRTNSTFVSQFVVSLTTKTTNGDHPGSMFLAQLVLRHKHSFKIKSSAGVGVVEFCRIVFAIIRVASCCVAK